MSMRGLDRAQADFDRQFRRDSLGHRINTFLACGTAFVACMPPGWAEVALWFPLAYALIRMTNTFPTIWRPWLMPAGLCILVFVAWNVLSLAWSVNPEQGRNEIGKLRFAFVILVMWPVLDRRPAIIAAISLGLLAGNMSQIVHAIGQYFDIAWMRYPLAGSRVGWAFDPEGRGDPERNGGWWHPLVGASMLVAGLGLHLPPAFFGRGRARVLGIGGSLASAVGVIATGSRGAVLAAAALVALLAGIALVRFLRSGSQDDHDRVPLGAKLVVVGGIAVFLGLVWNVAGDRVEKRAVRAADEVRRAINDKDFDSDNGARLLMAWWALEAVGERPVGGVGAGGYEAWVRHHLAEQGIDPASRRIFQHAHNAILHIAANTGIVGAALAIGVVGFAFVGGVRDIRRRGGGTWQGLGTYAAGPPFALLGLVLVSPFDPIQFNTTTAFLLFILVALCPWWMPSERLPSQPQQPPPP
jgi:O-antigen ligase